MLGGRLQKWLFLFILVLEYACNCQVTYMSFHIVELLMSHYRIIQMLRI